MKTANWKVAEVLRLKAEQPGLTCREIAARVGIGKTTVSEILRRDCAPPDASGGGEDQQFREEPDGTAVLSFHTEQPIRTLEDALRAAEVDTSIWYVERWECSQWTVPLRIRQGQEPVVLRDRRGETAALRHRPEQPVVTQQYRVRVFLRRIVPRAIGAAIDALYERLASRAPAYPILQAKQSRQSKPSKTGAGEPYLAVFGLFDAHFGKLCWAPETGSDYDLKLAESLFANAVDDLLAECQHRNVHKIVLPIGNDFYHVDNRRNTTYGGTPQDVDGRYAKVYEAGEVAVLAAVERLMETAPVQVVWVPGNHDPTISYHLARTVAAWFRRCDRVSVDHSPRPRKYVQWGTNLLGFTHGHVPSNQEDLPGLMAAECRAAWAGATCCEWLIGHQHRSRRWVTKDTDTHKGTTVRLLRSLAGTDSYHYENGFVGQSQAAEVYWYGRDRGYAGHAVVPARQ
jgi:hypothetical protein